MGDQQAVAIAIVLEGPTRGVTLGAIHLDDDVRRPEEVHGQTEQLNVDQGSAQTAPAAEQQEALLQLRPGERRADLVTGQQMTEGL